MWDHATESSSLLSIMFEKTLMKPHYIYVLVFFNRVLLDFTLNAIFFMDDYIEKGHDMPEKDVINKIILNFINYLINLFTY